MIRFDKIRLSYNEKNVLNDFSAEVRTGAKYLIKGRSGSGKSSLFAMVLGFVRPDRGRIFFNNTEIDRKNVWSVRQSIAFVDQDVSLGDTNVNDWIKFVFGLNANKGIEIHDHLLQLLDYFELSNDSMNKNINDLSGGERQRLALVIAILLKRPCFLLDEVTSSLDDNLKQKTVDLFAGMSDATVVVISHDDVWTKNPAFSVFDMEAVQ